MNIYDNIESYKDYFHSIRLHDSILLMDLKLPTTWEVKTVLALQPTTTQVKLNDKNDKLILISFYCPFVSEDVDRLFVDIDKIIKFNKDLEEKVNLLNLKKLELEKIFESNNIDSLRSINFDFNDTNREINLDETKPNLAGEGN